MVFQKFVLGVVLTAVTGSAFAQNEVSGVTPHGKMEQVTVSARNSKSDTRWQRVQKILTSSPAIEEVTAIESIDALGSALNALTAEEVKIQNKYAALLEINPLTLSNIVLFESIDEWYGTRYRYGGTTKKGIDCSAFVRATLKDAYGFELPRTAREQYFASRRVSTTELQEGDLVFFNTTGGISHVGVYLRNNKFAHASSSKGVTISDLFDPYYMSRYIGAGRIQQPDVVAKN